MKKKIPKIILILSFAPYVLCLCYGIYSMFNGFGLGLLFRKTYGFGAFMGSTVLMAIYLCYYPVIPICIIYQLVYLTVFIIKNRHNIQKKTILLIVSAVLLIFIIISAFCISLWW